MNFGNWTVGQNVRLKSMAVLWVDYNGSNVKTKIQWEFNEPDIYKLFCYATCVVNLE